MIVKARENPFRADQIEEKLPFDPTLWDTTWSNIFETWKTLHHRAAVVGPHGSGKSTLLKSLKKHFETEHLECEYLFLNDRKKKLDHIDIHRIRVSSSIILLLDGAEQLNPLHWFIFQYLTRHHRLITTQHKECRLATLIHSKTNVFIAQMLLEKLCLPQKEKAELDVYIAPLLKKHNGNIREVFRELYDLYSHEERVAEREGFEPSDPVTQVTSLAN